MNVDDIERSYRAFTRPDLGRRLKTLRLDAVYTKAQGDRLVALLEDGREHEVIDLVGGYGATLFGHNHPELVREAKRALDEGSPLMSQASVRPAAAKLAARLHERLLEDLGHEYVALFANTGSEAVEAAIKHAELRWQQRLDRLSRDLDSALERVRGALQRGGQLTPGARAVLGIDGGAEEIVRTLRDRFDSTVATLAPVHVAMERAYHGLTLGALRLTHGATYREPFEHLLGETVFVPFNDIAALEHALTEQRRFVTWPVARRGEVSLRTRELSAVASLFIEPIQGEGGVHVCSAAFATAARRWADAEEFDLVFDEIQCGMGRTGTFTFAEQLGVAPDTLTLSKSLGGGVAKISAALFRRARHVEEIGVLASSTFSEDELACRVATRALDVLEDATDPMTFARQTGARLQGGFEAIAALFPQAIRSVRGEGLMLGVELAEPPEESALRALSDQGLLGYTVAGHLLREHGVRVMPCISAPRVLRIEPSLYMQDAEIESVLDAFESVARALQGNDAFSLMRYLVDRREALEPRAFGARARVEPNDAPRVAFLTYFLDADHMARFDPSLARFTKFERQELIGRLYRDARPTLATRRLIRSVTGAQVELRSYALLIDAHTFHACLRGEGRAVVRGKIEEALELAHEDGCRIAALGGLTSVITANARDLRSPIPVTTGNSLTVAACLDAARQEVALRGIDLSCSVGAVVGAGGNIGSVYAGLIADDVAQLLLICRAGGEAALAPVAKRIVRRAARRAARGEATGLSATLLERRVDLTAPDAWTDRVLARGDGPVRISSDLSSLKSASLILGASNSPSAIIEPAHVGDNEVLLVDVAVPPDVDARVAQLGPRVGVISGGTIALGEPNVDFSLPAPIPRGTLYACATEGVVLGLERRWESFTRGTVRPDRVAEIGALAARHGFRAVAEAPRWDEGTASVA